MNTVVHRMSLYRSISWLVAIVLSGLPLAGVAALRTWTGNDDMNWTQPDSTSWDATYAWGDDVLFTGAGIGTITIPATVNPSNMVFTHAAGTYIFSGASANIFAGGSISNLGGGIVQFGNMGNTPLAGLAWTGATYIANGSELRLTRPSVVGVANTPIQLVNGGIISFGADNSAAYFVQNPIVVANGGTIRAEHTSNTTRHHITNVVSGTGLLRLHSYTASSDANQFSGLTFWGNQNAFTGTILIEAAPASGMDVPSRAQTRLPAVWFTNAAAMFPNAASITVRDGGMLGFETPLTDAILAKVTVGPRGGIGVRHLGTLHGVTDPMAWVGVGGLLLLDNQSAFNTNRYPDTVPLAITNRQVSIIGRAANNSPVTEAVGPMTVVGAAHLHLRRQNATDSGVVLAPASLATPGPGSSLLIETDSMNNPALGDGLGSNTIYIVTGGARPAVTNGILPVSMQYFNGGTALGQFLTYSTGDTNRIVPATYSSSDINTAGANDTVSSSTAQTLTSTKTVYAIRYGADLTLNSGITLTLGSGGVIINNNILGAGGTLHFPVPGYIGAYGSGSVRTIAPLISGSAGLVIMGNMQTLVINNTNNTFTGGVWINGGGVRFTGNAANLNDITVSPFGRLVAGTNTGTQIDIIGGLRGEGLVSSWNGSSVGTGAGMLNIAAPSGTYLFDGVMTNGTGGREFALIKSGGATQILGSNFLGRYTGNTFVSGGVLRVDGNLARSPTVFVRNGARLEGTGLIGGNIFVGDAFSTLAPGASPGTLTVSGSVTMASGTIFEAEILGPLSGQYDVLAMLPAGTLTLGGATLNVIAPLALPYSSVYPIISGWGVIDSSTFDGLPDGSTLTAGPNQFVINYGTKPGYIDSVTLTVVPEPGSLALPSLIGLLVFLRRRLG